jgi:hypothetical protein
MRSEIQNDHQRRSNFALNICRKRRFPASTCEPLLHNLTKLATVVPKVLFKLCYFVSDLSKNMAVMRFWLVHFQESSSWEPLNGFECNLVWMFLWRSLTSFDSFSAIYEFQNDHLWRSTFYWNSIGNNIFIIFSRNTQQTTTKLGTFVNFMCVYKCPVRSQ